MQIVIAPDSFKESISATEAVEALEEGIKERFPDARITSVPLADGGEGFVKAFLKANGGREVVAKARDPLGRTIKTFYGISGTTAIIEMAAASGLEHLRKEERNPYYTTTQGTGDLILDALNRGIWDFTIGLGGSATNDGGAGMLEALGAKLLNAADKQVRPGGRFLSEICEMNLENVPQALYKSTFLIACDVTNPLSGPNGASRVFAPQKGASRKMAEHLDENLKHWGKLLETQTGKKIVNIPGTGAAGGVASAFLAFFPCTLKPGIQILIEKADLEEKILSADLVITGEGKVDSQTLKGKTVWGVSQLTKKHHKPLVIIAGAIEKQLRDAFPQSTRFFSLTEKAGSTEAAIKASKHWLQKVCEDL